MTRLSALSKTTTISKSRVMMFGLPKRNSVHLKESSIQYFRSRQLTTNESRHNRARLVVPRVVLVQRAPRHTPGVQLFRSNLVKAAVITFSVLQIHTRTQVTVS